MTESCGVPAFHAARTLRAKCPSWVIVINDAELLENLCNFVGSKER